MWTIKSKKLWKSQWGFRIILLNRNIITIYLLLEKQITPTDNVKTEIAQIKNEMICFILTLHTRTTFNIYFLNGNDFGNDRTYCWWNTNDTSPFFTLILLYICMIQSALILKLAINILVYRVRPICFYVNQQYYS